MQADERVMPARDAAAMVSVRAEMERDTPTEAILKAREGPELVA